MTNVFDTLRERGFVQQTSHEDKLAALLAEEKVTAYVGFDPTSDSLHVGHLLPLMALVHLGRAGHRPIALIGGGTAMIGDPSGRTELRKMMSKETVNSNFEGIKKQLQEILSRNSIDMVILNNADWIWDLNYIDFLREIGSQFSVNRMLTAECFKSRLERGLSFIEFNYMLLQAYDFLKLYRDYGCRLQLGGDDQWSNILAGADLIRRLEQAEAYVLTIPLLTTSSGKKMGKTEAGAVWLDSNKTTPYEFYQYWRNCDDADVEKLLALYTLLPMDEVRALGALEGEEINRAKQILAFEVTKFVHGETEAQKAQDAALALFGAGGSTESVPVSEISRDRVAVGIDLGELMSEVGLSSSNSEARRLIDQGGVYVNDIRVCDRFQQVTLSDVKDGKIVLRKGKKTYRIVRVI
ncbi:MAG: tyrosine--tRNA ligase [Bacillota bacterium]|jgi:tyrosyl-tRNA synthetase|nr:tyrosine--tRNA ligase [Bacillota bacterium]HOB91010.1 tyrosine--tRNA ligase [Bacillota bacterium]HPZ54136.1 tyrosine--tRNA ligase [Bacillota bacterium]